MDLVLLDVRVNGNDIPELGRLCVRDRSQRLARSLVEKLTEVIPRQQIGIKIQAALGKRVLAKSNISATRKNVLAKCYGGDVTRKKKLLAKQAAGKKKMKALAGDIRLPQNAFARLASVA